MADEKAVEKYLCRSVKRLGGTALKFVSPGVVGVPDRIVLLPGGKLYFIECKALSGRLSKLQTKNHETLRKLGFEVRVVNSRVQISDFIREVKEK